MSSSRRDVIVAVVLSAAIVGVMEGIYRPAGSEARVHAQLAKLSSDLNLTPAQEREIEEILREEAEAAAAGDPLSRRAFEDRLEAVLTDEQRERLRRLRAERLRRPPDGAY